MYLINFQLACTFNFIFKTQNGGGNVKQYLTREVALFYKRYLDCLHIEDSYKKNFYKSKGIFLTHLLISRHGVPKVTKRNRIFCSNGTP